MPIVLDSYLALDLIPIWDVMFVSQISSLFISLSLQHSSKIALQHQKSKAPFCDLIFILFIYVSFLLSTNLPTASIVCHQLFCHLQLTAVFFFFHFLFFDPLLFLLYNNITVFFSYIMDLLFALESTSTCLVK